MAATVHPFPARMAPELALQALAAVPSGGMVVDPMAGSGTVLRHASDNGCHALGFDMDPLAVLMSRVWTTPVRDETIGSLFERARSMALAIDPLSVHLPWIDDDQETREFIDYWFGKSQAADLRCWVRALQILEEQANDGERAAIDVLKIALSRIIITKEQCASLARDTSHSRPHRVATTSSYCVHQGVDRSLKVVRKRLRDAPPSGTVAVGLGDARSLNVESDMADAVLTSPPYLNAIDYMRGHRLSLVWLGFSLRQLREIRSNSVGAERAPNAGTIIHSEIRSAFRGVDQLPPRYNSMIDRYVADLFLISSEIKRILKPGGIATIVVGNSCLKSVFIENSRAVARSLEISGLEFISETRRPLPSQSRYLPTSEGSSLAKRMREEIVLKYRA